MVLVWSVWRKHYTSCIRLFGTSTSPGWSLSVRSCWRLLATLKTGCKMPSTTLISVVPGDRSSPNIAFNAHVPQALQRTPQCQSRPWLSNTLASLIVLTYKDDTKSRIVMTSMWASVMKHATWWKMIAKYMLTFGLDETRHLLPSQNGESPPQEKASKFYWIRIQQKFFAKELTMEGCLYLEVVQALDQIDPGSHWVAQQLMREQLGPAHGLPASPIPLQELDCAFPKTSPVHPHVTEVSLHQLLCRQMQSTFRETLVLATEFT